MAKVIEFLTGDVGFLACILLPVLLIAGFIFRDAVRSMKKAIADAKKHLDEEEQPKVALSEQEYAQLYKQVEEEMRKEMAGHVEQPENGDLQVDVVSSPASDTEA